jgi:hypothetical protein
LFDFFGHKKRHQELLAKLDKIDQNNDMKIAVIADTLQKILNNQKFSIDYYNEFNQRLISFISRLDMVRAGMDDITENFAALTKVVDAEKLIKLGDVATELKRIVKVVDLLNDTIHDNILNEVADLGDIIK